MKNKKFSLLLTSLLLISQTSFANDLVYHPQNSAFGGSAGTTQVLLAKANAQNKTEAKKKSEAEKFQDQLQRTVLRQITRTITNSFADDSISLEGKTFGTEDFNVDVLTDSAESVVLQIENFTDGTVSTITIPKL